MSFTVPLPPRTQLYHRSCSNKHTDTYTPHPTDGPLLLTYRDSGTRPGITPGGGSGYRDAALKAHAGGALYGTELGSVTLQRMGLSN